MNDDDNPDPHPAPPSSAAAPEASPAPAQLRPRREPFEHGLIPIPKLIFSDGILTLGPLKQRLLEISPSGRIGAQELAGALQIPPDHARLAIDTLASVHHSGTSDLDGEADVHDLILFLYVQNYKRLLPRAHKDSAAVADVWPSTSAFDGYLSVLSPLQLVRSNSRRSMPSQADEEAHQLSYLQKHMGNILALLAESVESDSDEPLVLTFERFESLGFLIQFGEKASDGVPLCQAAPFFANSYPDMPAVPVSAAHVHEWLLQQISASLEYNAERTLSKENGPASDSDITMTDACVSHTKAQSSGSPGGSLTHCNATYSRNLTFVEGFSKTSVVKLANDIKGHSVKVLNCHDSFVYILAPLRYATVYGCSDTTIILGAIGKAVRIEHCERVHVVTAAKRICIANCRECVFFLGVNQQPLILGDNHKLQVAPYNTFYAQLEEHMAQVGVDANVNKWDEPVVLGLVDPHDSLSHPAGVADVQAESASRLDPDQFTNLLIPSWFSGEGSQPTKYNPFPLPEAYMASQMKKLAVLGDLQQTLRGLQLEESKKRELACALHVQFKEWLYASGNIRQLYCLQGD